MGNSELPKSLLVPFFLSFRQGLIGSFTPVLFQDGNNSRLGNIFHSSFLATNTAHPLPFVLVLRSPGGGAYNAIDMILYTEFPTKLQHCPDG